MNDKLQDKLILKHTLRVEMMDGTALLFNIDQDEKEDLEKYLDYRTDALHESENSFIQVITVEERVVYIRIKAIKRLIFCWDAAVFIVGGGYHDNFEVSEKYEKELLIPDVIIKFKDAEKPLCFCDLDPEGDFLLLDHEDFSNRPFLKTGFLSLPDEDGEQNYIPVVNITCLEVKRDLVIPDEIWEEIKEQRNLESGKKKAKAPKGTKSKEKNKF